jgi:hypothetical protein
MVKITPPAVLLPVHIEEDAEMTPKVVLEVLENTLGIEP